MPVSAESTLEKPSAKSEPPPTPPAPRLPGYLQALKCSIPTRNEDYTRIEITEDEAKQRYKRHSKEIVNQVVGPMPLDQYFCKFLSVETDTAEMPKPVQAFADVPQPKRRKGFKETTMNKPLTAALNKTTKGVRRCPGIIFVDTGDHGDGKFGSKPDISAYLDGTRETRAKAGLQQIFTELKMKDFACDHPANGKGFLFDHLSQTEREAAELGLGQQAYYAAKVCTRQHRKFLFSIFMTPTHARFLRWDRAGVIISESFDYRAQPERLCEFLWRFGHMSHDQRGGDTFVVVATKAEEQIFKKAIETHIKAQLGHQLLHATLEQELSRHYEANAVTKMTVRKSMVVRKGQAEGEMDGNSPKATTSVAGLQRGEVKADPQELVTFDENSPEEEYLISHPVASPRSLASRGTRAYWAVHVKDKTVHFLKDAWRTDVEGMEIEGRIIEKLASKGVRNIPTVVCWSDAGPVINLNGQDCIIHSVHSTQTDAYKHVDWNIHNPKAPMKNGLIRRVHYRQVTKEAGYTLEQLSGTYELLRGAHDVFEALRDAHSQCNRFHRDVSSTNIILFADPTHPCPRRRAILVDWELSNEDVPGPARDHWISGTWAFMSINTLSGAAWKRRYHVVDDVESLIYVVFYCAVHFLRWDNYTLMAHDKINELMFYQHSKDNTGGVGKLANLQRGMYFNETKLGAVSDWLEKAFKLLKLYAEMDAEALPQSGDIFTAYNDVFDQQVSYWDRLPISDRYVNAIPRTGPQQSAFPATSVTFHHTSKLQASALAKSIRSSLKRGHGSIEQQSSERTSKRKKEGDKEGEEVTAAAHPKGTVVSRMKDLKGRTRSQIRRAADEAVTEQAAPAAATRGRTSRSSRGHRSQG